VWRRPRHAVPISQGAGIQRSDVWLLKKFVYVRIADSLHVKEHANRRIARSSLKVKEMGYYLVIAVTSASVRPYLGLY
jgi:hypothetical protein